MGVYGIAVLGFFSHGISVILILMAVLRYHLALRCAVFHHFGCLFGETRLFTVLRYCLFVLSFRRNTQNKTQ